MTQIDESPRSDQSRRWQMSSCPSNSQLSLTLEEEGWGGEGPAGTLPEFTEIAGDEGKDLFCHYLNSSPIFSSAII